MLYSLSQGIRLRDLLEIKLPKISIELEGISHV